MDSLGKWRSRRPARSWPPAPRAAALSDLAPDGDLVWTYKEALVPESMPESLLVVGDVAGPPWLAHKATHEGVLVAEQIAGVQGLQPLDTARIPSCTYCRPQVASVGISEAQAVERNIEVKVGRFPFAANGKAIALGEPDGFVKTLFDASTGELLGAHLIGAEVTELIQGFVVAMGLETTEAELMHTVFAHPTLSEALHESVLDAWGRALHI